MAADTDIIHEIPGLYRIVRLKAFRRTENVSFDLFPIEVIPHIDAIDRVIHRAGATSPGPVGSVQRPWYMHPHQDDHLIVLHGTRHVDVYTRAHGRIEHFTAQPDRIERNGELLYDGPAALVWPHGVFHRVRSGEDGSASLNLATHHAGFDIQTSFNIYDLDVGIGQATCIRNGHLDQE